MKKTFLTGLLSTALFGSSKYFFDLLVGVSTGVVTKVTLEVKVLMLLFGTSSMVFLLLLVAVVFLMRDD